ncbi:MAG: prepilin-type N-terminal cleavage/methylation domain-containing protein [Candidatus Staskawiczbacteria bacterium]|nr:prepilin-type N-terminal cleavage/methylation domain-containing protein [Candidatus Staskawiczbacteria bacterium]
MNKSKGLALSQSKGFTIIELIVVIAIIAVLAAIVLVNVTQYINKGKDAAARGNLASMMTRGTVYIDTPANNGKYNTFCTATTGGASINTALTAAGYTMTCACDSGATNTCTDPSTKWCASVVLKNDATKSFCVDSSGKKVEAATASATCATGACP